MMGRTVSTRRRRFARKPVRVTTRANARPSPVVVVAVRSARSNVFQATPQLRPPVTQSSRQIFAVNSRSAKARPDGTPSAPRIALSKIRARGKNVKSPTSTVTRTTAPATKASPLKKPRAASPSAKRIRKLAATSAAPVPIPGWPPIAKPWTPTYRTPAPPSSIRRRPKAARSPPRSALTSDARSTRPGPTRQKPRRTTSTGAMCHGRSTRPAQPSRLQTSAQRRRPFSITPAPTAAGC